MERNLLDQNLDELENELSRIYMKQVSDRLPIFFTHFWIQGTYKTLQYVISCTAVNKKPSCNVLYVPKVSEKNGQPVRVSFGKKLLLTELVL